jgi:hypothetical protein
MEAATTIRGMISGNKIIVPTYQRAYSWDTPKENSSKTPTDVFLKDLIDYSRSKTKSSYYFGHFLFEKKDKNTFHVIDGQQRLTTIVIFISAIYKKLSELRELTTDEKEQYEDIIKRNNTIRFETVYYDNQIFKDYVIEQTRVDKNGLETESSKRIVAAFDYFLKQISNESETNLINLIKIISDATCTTHQVTDEAEAIQMFIFQNNRGKKPSNLEIIKAQFMFNVHLYATDDRDELIKEIKERFEKIYKSISSIEYNIDEDEVLLYALRVHFNSLKEQNALEKINKNLSISNPIPFIKSFSQTLATSFDHLKQFFGTDEKNNFSIHSIVTLGGISIAIPFILKAYKYGLNITEIGKLCTSLESLVIRHRLIGTKAEITSRLNDVYSSFDENNKSIKPIIERIQWIKTAQDYWWSFWNNNELERCIQGGIHHSIAKYILWKYENSLKSQGANGYSPMRYTEILNPHLEHIAPSTEPKHKPHGYNNYSDEFINQYQNCLGNYLLLSESHNCGVGNIAFKDKLVTYIHLAQQREINDFISDNGKWTKESIQKRKEKIVNFVLQSI